MGMLVRIVFAVILVAATWNPTGYSYVQWALIDTSTFDATTSDQRPSCTKLCDGMCSACAAAGAMSAYARAAGSPSGA